MKKILNIFLLLILSGVAMAQDFDRSIRPSAAPAKAVEINDAQQFVLPNGLKVFVVEDHRAPIVYYGLSLDIYPALEGNKTGMQSLFTEVIGTATKTRSKEQLNRETDLIGAQISSHTHGGAALALKKHETRLLELFSDVVLNPVFLQSELDLNLEKGLSALKMLDDNASALNQRVSAALTYGSGFPDGELETEATLNNIVVADLEQYHRTYFAPNVARLVIVGDITLKEARDNATKYFGKWAKKNVPVGKYTIPTAPAETKVAFIEKSGAVQSSIDVSYPVTLLPAGAPDQLSASVMSYLFGGGMGSRLVQSLRETHSYTYGVYGVLSPGDLTGRLNLTSGRGAGQVKAAATDSAIGYIRQEMEGMINTPVSEQELEDAKAYFAGNFGRSLENPETIARFALNIEKYKLPKDYFRTYLQRLAAVTVADVQAAARKYLRPNNAWIVVTGDKQHADGLKQFAGNGNVQFYDVNANPIEAPVTKQANISADEVIEHYITALGGRAALESINDYKLTADMMMGQKVEITQLYKKPHYTLSSMSIGGAILQKEVFNGKTVKTSGMSGSKELTEGEEFESKKAAAAICPEMNYIKDGYTLTVQGIEKVNGNDAYVLIVTKGESTKTEYYDVVDGLKIKSVETAETPQGAVQVSTEYGDYKVVGGVKFAHKMKQSVSGTVMDTEVKSIEINKGLDDALFN